MVADAPSALSLLCYFCCCYCCQRAQLARTIPRGSTPTGRRNAVARSLACLLLCPASKWSPAREDDGAVGCVYVPSTRGAHTHTSRGGRPDGARRGEGGNEEEAELSWVNVILIANCRQTSASQIEHVSSSSSSLEWVSNMWTCECVLRAADVIVLLLLLLLRLVVFLSATMTKCYN